MTFKQIGIDIGKSTFHVVALDANGDIAMRKQFTRSRLLAFFADQRGECLRVAFEACSGAHWLAHQLIALGQGFALRPDTLAQTV